jgi:hypothetical protein
VIAAIAILAQLTGGVGPACAAILERPPGTRWIYRGSRAWSTGTGVDSGSVTWTMTLDSVRPVAPAGRIGLLRGFVTDLAWSDPTTVPGRSVVICRGGILEHITFDQDSTAMAFYVHWPTVPSEYADTLLVEPLRDGAQWGGDSARTDGLYRWIVAPADSLPAIPIGCHGGSPAYDATFTTLPDNQIITWMPGAGLVHYYFWHHGTPAAAEVWLAACQGPSIH